MHKTITWKEYVRRHITSHKKNEICSNCPPSYKKCCDKCYQVNTAHATSQDYCKKDDCLCHEVQYNKQWQPIFDKMYQGWTEPTN